MKQCPRCNRSFDDSQSFCLEDGSRLVINEPARSDPTVLLHSSKKSKLPYIFIGLIVATALAIGGAAFFISSTGDMINDRESNRLILSNVRSPSPSPVTTPTGTPTPFATPTASPFLESEVSSNSEANLDSTVTSKPPDEIAEKQLPVIMRAEDHLVLFALHQCRKSGSSIICDFSLTNKGDDRRFELSSYSSKLFDEMGNGYNGSEVRIAKESGRSPYIEFIKGVTTKAQMTFDKVEPNTTKITLLNLGFDVGRDNRLAVKFRNVPLTISN